MSRFSWLSGLWFQSTVAVWWDAWLEFWGYVGSRYDRRELAIERSMSFDHLDADMVAAGGGNFDGAGTGGQD